MGTQEEQEVGATPTRGWYRYRTGRESDGVLTPASRSSPSELGSILSASDDDSRPATKREVELLQVRIKGMFSNLRAALNDEVQRRDTVDTLVAGQIETLQSQLPALNSQLTALNTQLQFQQGALASSRDQAERHGDDMFKMMNDLHDTIANIRSTPPPTTTTTVAEGQLVQPTRPTVTPGTSLLREVIHADAEDSLHARIESLHEAITASMSDLRGQVLTANDQLSAGLQEQLQELNDKVEAVESATATAVAEAATAAAMIIAVDGTAQEAVARLSEADQRSDPWSDWDILQAKSSMN